MDNPYYSNPNQGSYYDPNQGPYPGQYQQPKKKRWYIPVIIIAVIIAVVAFFVISIGSAVGSITGGGTTVPKTYTPPASGEYIAKVSICGEIGSGSDPYSSSDASYHHQWTMNAIDKLINDDGNVALYLYVDTPGGSVYESDELYEKIEQYKKETDRPVYVYMAHMAASGGYYIAAPADHIFANRNATTGSIGVIIGTLYDVSGFLNEHGIRTEDITSGKNKAMGSNFAPLTDEQRAIYQSIVDEAYNRFVSIVADGRGMSIDDVKALADGRVYTATQAKENGLIDEVALNADAENVMLGRHPGATINSAVYPADYSFWNNIFASMNDNLPGMKDGFGQDGDVSAVLELMEQGQLKPQLYYLYEG